MTRAATATQVLRMDRVTAGYYANDTVLDQVSLEARPGRVTVVLGPNGSGKSTSLRVLSGFLNARSGRTMLGSEGIDGLPPGERLARGIALLPQGRSVFPGLTVEENLRLGAWMLRKSPQRLQAAVDAMYDRYPVLRPLRSRPAGSLSGGQARLLEFGRTLILEPSVLLIDEPSVGLAPVLVDQVYDEIARLRDEGRTILLVDQNVQAAIDMADYVYTLAYGRNHLQGERSQFADELDSLIKQWLNL
ncbi:MAG TPA: ABC transporter ATP-binding protein [Nakamurella sp.]|jgi:branched-chain amino acid transport system ATP-binding protein|nr:ABC transporter ATP-binding protein [Nakamurella sp.]